LSVTASLAYACTCEAGDLAEEKRPEIEDALAEAINRQVRDADGIVIDSSSWVISARNPGD